MMVVGVDEVVRDAMFIRLNVATKSTFSMEEDNKKEIGDVSLNLCIKNYWHVIYLNLKNQGFLIGILINLNLVPVVSI